MINLNYLNSTKNFIPNHQYLIGSARGVKPHFVLMAPKKLYEWTNYPAFDLLDIVVRGYNNLPKIDASWDQLGIKTALFANSGIRLLRYINVLSPRTEMRMDSLILFTNTISVGYSLIKGTSLIRKATILTNNKDHSNQKEEFAENFVSGLLYCVFASMKIYSFLKT